MYLFPLDRLSTPQLNVTQSTSDQCSNGLISTFNGITIFANIAVMESKFILCCCLHGFETHVSQCHYSITSSVIISEWWIVPQHLDLSIFWPSTDQSGRSLFVTIMRITYCISPLGPLSPPIHPFILFCASPPFISPQLMNIKLTYNYLSRCCLGPGNKSQEMDSERNPHTSTYV